MMYINAMIDPDNDIFTEEILLILLALCILFSALIGLIKIKMEEANENFFYKLFILHKNLLTKKIFKHVFDDSLKKHHIIKNDIKNVLNENFNENVFNDYFLKNYKIILKNKMKFNNKSNIIEYIDHNIYDFLTIDNKFIINKFEKHNFYNIIGNFLEIYSCNIISPKCNLCNLSRSINEDCFFINEKIFKNNLIFLMLLGNKIIININRNKEIEHYINIFNEKFSKIFSDIKDENNSITDQFYPKQYDWKIYINYYTLILCQKLYLDLKTYNIINNHYLNEIFFYIPDLNYSKKTKRHGLMAHIINIRYIIAKIFQYDNDYIGINTFLYKNIKSLLINFTTTNNDLIFFSDGGIVCHNMINYNYNVHLLYPYTLYYMLCNKNSILEKNLNIILRNLFKTISNIKLINPILLNNTGNNFKLYNNIVDYYYKIQYLDLLQKNIYFYALTSNNLNIYNTENLEHIKSINLLIGKFNKWCIQIKFPSKYIISKNFSKYNCIPQIMLSKILFFDNILFNDTYKHNLTYPGMIFYNKKIINNPGIYYLTKFKFDYIKFGDYFVALSKIYSYELNLIYNEFVFVTPYGIIVGYFNVIKLINEKTYLCYNSPIYNNIIDTGVLYNDISNDDSEDNEFFNILTQKINYNINNNKNFTLTNNKYFTKFNANVLYYNFYYKTIIKLMKLTDYCDNICIKLIIDDKKYLFNLNYIDNIIDLKIT